MQKLIQKLFTYRVRALMLKELVEIKRDRRMVASLTVQPVMQILLIGFALNATVTNLRLGVVDDSRTTESRALIATMTESKSFRLSSTYFSTDQLGDSLSRGKLDAGVVIPHEYARDLQRGRPTTVQFLLNATNSNTATIAQGYAEGVIQSYNNGLAADGLRASFQSIHAPMMRPSGRVILRPAFLYNPGLDESWFTVTGVFGLLLILNGSLVASTTAIKERESGTIEQLLMSPASPSEIILAKITPLFCLMCFMIVVAMVVIKIVFHVPFQGSLLLVFAGASLCALSGIGIGTVTATFSKSAQQALLTSFFINPPLVSLSGALTPVEAMPKWLQPLTALNPITHFVNIVRGCMLKGSGFDVLWPNFLALLIITLVLISLSSWRFRNQLS
jgi:ABC-2 type transport system permease protein